MSVGQIRLRTGWVVRYGLAFVAVAAMFGLRLALTAWVGPGLPTYITFYPAVMVAALLAGVGPGLLATALTGLTTAYWILPPEGFTVGSPVDRVGLVLFAGMGLFMSAVAELYRRDRRKAAAYDQEVALRETRREKEFLADVLEHASQPFAVGYSDGRVGLCNRAYEQLTGYSAKELRALNWATALTPPEWRELEQQKLEDLHRSGRPVRYQMEYVRKDGTKVPIELLVHLAKDAEGQPEYYYSFLTDITERKRAEEALRQSEQHFRTMADAIPQLAWIAKADGWIHWYNRRWYEYTGTTPEQMEGWGWQSIHDPDALPKVLEQWKACIATGEPFDMTFPLRGADGVFRPFLTRATPLKDESGRVLQWFGTNTDVSEQKRAEEALKKAHDELETRIQERTAELRAASRYSRSLIEASLDPLVTISPDGKITDVNEATEAVTGCARTALIGTDFCDYFTDPDKARAGYQQVFREGFVRDYPLELRHRDGRIVSVLYHASVYRDESGKVIGVFAAARDITERKRAEEVVRQAGAYNRSLLEASLDPLVTIGHDGRITDVNQATELVTGVARGQLIGSNFSDYFTEPEKANAGYQKVLAEGLVHDYPLTIRHVSGRATDVLYNATVYRNEAGEVQGVFAAARDITERKRAEAELASYRDHLEELVEQRTTELARSNQELEQFAYVASHDLQEPLRAVAGYLNLIEDRLRDKLDDKGRHHLDGAVQGAARMHSLITDLLALSRVGTQGNPLVPTGLDAVLDRALQSLNASAREAGATITRDPLPTLSVDATQMTQLFQNLIGNAIKFHADRPPQIHVSAQQQAHDQWLFAVRDNGIGIEPQYFERIFLVFQRLHTRKEYPGTGIGLAICKKIVERHAGRIWVESQPGQGSTFYFTIPNKGGP